MSFVRRKIDVEFGIGSGPDGLSGSETIMISGMRCLVIIESSGLPGLGTLHARIHGLTLGHLNQLSSFQYQAWNIRNNTITITAGDVSAMSLVYKGLIQESWANMNGQPDVLLEVSAVSCGALAMKPVSPTSYNGGVDVGTVLGGLASQAGLKLVNHGVAATMATPYLQGSSLEQIRESISAANVLADIRLGELHIWPYNAPLADASNGPIDISPRTGMVGYPAYNGGFVTITTLFNPSILIGSQIKVTSQLTAACGLYNVCGVSHRIESETPNGSWFTTVKGYYIAKP